MLDILKTDNVELDELSRIQKEVAKSVIKEDKLGKLETIAGCDVSFAEENRAFAACVLMEYPSLKVVDKSVVEVEIDFPYIPTFLAFREIQPMLTAVKEIDSDIYMIDSQGLAHPRRAGLASHLGVVIDKPTIGVAKSRLCGEAEEPGKEKGSYSILKDDGDEIGAAVRTITDTNPVYVSIGHKVSLEKAIEITLNASPKFKIPEPIRSAHKLATRAMKKD